MVLRHCLVFVYMAAVSFYSVWIESDGEGNLESFGAQSVVCWSAKFERERKKKNSTTDL